NYKRRPDPGGGFKSDGALMFFYYYRMGNSQTLAGAFTHRLCSKKRIKNLRLDRLRYSRPGIADPNLNISLFPASADADGSLSARVLEDIGDRVSGVHDQVEHHLVQL